MTLSVLPFFTGVGAGAETGSFSPSDLKNMGTYC